MIAGQDRLFAGAMSGTSADGVDAAIVAVRGRGLQMSARLIYHHHVPYKDDLKRLIFAARGGGAVRLADLAKLGREVSHVYARVVNEAVIGSQTDAKQIVAIAAHGQTLFHNPPNTIQWLDPALVASKTGCTVVSDFRRADCAAGGQGAPLVPFADYILFRDPAKSRVLLNIGGIANITWLKAGGAIDEVIAFDTGPGNCVVDQICRTEYPGGPGYDAQGSIARQNMPLGDAVQKLFDHSFFKTPPPRSTDVPAMIEMFESLPELRDASPSRRISSAVDFTIRSIELAIKTFLPAKPDELIISGGGTRNTFMMEQLAARMGSSVKSIDEYGIPSEAKEAVAFALLAAATIDGVPSNIPSVTGAGRAVVLGSITPKP